MKHTLNKKSRILLIAALVLILSFLPSCVAKQTLNNFLASSKEKPKISSESQAEGKAKAKDQAKPQEQAKSPDKGQDQAEEKSQEQTESEAETQEPSTKREAEALAVAKRYLSLMKGQFSHESLMRQLAFEGFSPEEAQYAADNCGEDWFAAAITQAQSHLKYGHFSYKSLIKMLTEQEGFTLEEATYAVDSFDIDWMEQAAGKAQDWVSSLHTTKESLTRLLTSDGFTEEQVAYGLSAVGY